MKEIPLTKGYVAIVDDEDYERVTQFNWCALVEKHSVYAGRTAHYGGGDKKPQRMILHRFILNAPRGMQVDHIDGNGLNNTRANMRIVTRRQNQWNRRPLQGRSVPGIRGVNPTRIGDRFVARIKYNGKCIHIGIFDSEIEAAAAYNNKARELFGEFAWLNPIPEAA